MTDPILVAFDGREASNRALHFALDRAVDSETGLHVVHVTSGNEETESQIREEIERRISNHPHGEDVITNTTFIEGQDENMKPAENTAAALRDYLEDAATKYQYLVLGNQKHDMIHKTVVGSVTETLISDRTIPVLLVP